jgi:hypothetical protein
VTEAEAAPVWRTNVLWAILAVFLVLGTVGAGTFVFGFLWIVAGIVVDGAIVAAFGAIVAFLSFLYMAGILYRVDRYRGANKRRIELFE